LRVVGDFKMRRLLYAFAILLAPATALSETCTVTTSATWTSATQDISATCTEDASDTFVFDDGATVTIAEGTAITVAKAIVTGGALVVSGTLNLTGCNDADARVYGNAPCGATSGTFSVQGRVLHDSVVDGAIFTQMTKQTSDASRMRLNFNATPSGGNFAAGDILWFESGPAKHHAYRVAAVNTAGCASATVATCYIDIEMYRSGTAFGTSAFPDTANYARNIAYPDTSGSPSAPSFNGGRLASTANANYVTNGLDKKVVVCSAGASPCTASALLAANGAYTGWYYAAQETGTGVYTDASLITRTMIVNSENDVATPISGDSGTVDVLHLIDPVPLDDLLSAGNLSVSVRTPNGIIWPGFWNADAWKLIRPAQVFYTGSEPDGNFGVYGPDGCFDVDYGHLKDFAVVSVAGGTSATTAQTSCTAPFSYTLVQEYGGGNGTELTHASNGGGCDLQAVDLAHWASVSVSNLAITDHRTPANTTTTCCATGGSGASCASGTGNLASNDDTTSAVHGLYLYNATNVSVTGYYGRYIGDDMLLWTVTSAVPESGMTLAVDGAVCWWLAQGTSGECMSTASAARPVVVTATDVVSINGNAGAKNGCSLGIVSTTPSATESVSVSRAVLIDNRSSAPGVYNYAGNSGGSLSNAFLFARDQDGGTSARTCSAANATNLAGNWIDGWAAIATGTTGQSVTRTFWQPEASSSPGSAMMASQPSVDHVYTNNHFQGLPVQPITDSAANGSTLAVRNNFFGWSAVAQNALGVRSDGSQPIVDVSYNVFDGATMFNCVGTTWGGLYGANIHDNMISNNAGGANPAVSNMNRCTGIGAVHLLNSSHYLLGGLLPSLPSGYGPQGRVGIGDRSLLDELDIRSPFRIKAGGGSGWIPKGY
jgi:hypothetical protein